MPGSLNLGHKSRDSGRTEGFVEFPAGVRIFDPERPCRRMYLLRSGRVLVLHKQEAVLDYLKAGDFFGEECFLAPPSRQQLAKSLTPVRVGVFRISDLLDRLQQDRRFARRLLRSLAARLDSRTHSIRDFVTEPAERRLARLLYRLTPARNASGWVRLRFTPSNSEMARTVGTTRARISFFMGHFQRLGWLERRPTLRVRRDGLREFLGAEVCSR